MPPRCYFHSDIPPRPLNTKKSALKKTQGGRIGRDRPRRAIAYVLWYIGENEITSPLGVSSARFRGRWARGCIGHATSAFCLLVHRFGMISVGLHAHDSFSPKLDPKIGGILRGAPSHLHKSEATVIESTSYISYNRNGFSSIASGVVRELFY